MHTDIANFCMDPGGSLLDAIAKVERMRLGIALVVDADYRLLGTVTDGDIRRAMLDRLRLDLPITAVLERKAHKPITASVTADQQTWLRLLQEHNIVHLPLLDAERRVVAVVTLDEVLPSEPPPLRAVVMAGGAGTRLLPLTEGTPKPMLQVGNKPLLEIILGQLREAGITTVKVTTHHMPEKIKEYFGDGKQLGIELSYVEESRPLGTGGGLGLMDTPKETTLVINGDILTQVDFRAMRAFHQEHHAELTVAVRHYDLKVPYGVVECDGPIVRRVSEKPVQEFFVNAGIYLLEPSVYEHIPSDRHFDMTELIQRLLDDGRPVIGFPIREYWLDIGEHAEYERAEEDVRSGKVKL